MSHRDLMFTVQFEIEGLRCNTFNLPSNEEAEDALETLQAVDAVDDAEIVMIE